MGRLRPRRAQGWASGGRGRLQSVVMDFDALIRDIPDFPSEGIVFKDITPLLDDPEGFGAAIEALAAPYEGRVDRVIGIEARGFILAAPIALRLGAGFVPVRKAGKLPAATIEQAYALEYGTATIEMHADALAEGDRVLVVDDVLATGGTAEAAVALVTRSGATVAGLSFLIELDFLDGRTKLAGHDITTLLHY